MTFEDSLRDRLHREADAVPLPERAPARAAADARSRRRRRQTAAGVGAVAAVMVIVAGIAIVPDRADEGDDATDVATDVAVGATLADLVPATGPLAFDWQPGGDGLYRVQTSFQAADGTVYALSTGPGFIRSEGDPASPTLYRMGADGAWQPVDLETDGRPEALDVTANGDALYAVSTGPGAAADESVAQLSASTDGGDTWAIEDLPAPAPPSDLTWRRHPSLSVETAGDTTLALVTTSFDLDLAASFPELGDHIVFEPTEEGIVIVPINANGADAVMPIITDAATGEEADGGGHTRIEIPGSRTLTWDELGLTGPEDLTVHQVVRNTGDGWEPVETTGLPENVTTLAAAGSRFVAENGYALRGVSVSDDGVTWMPVALPEAEPDASMNGPDYDVLTFGGALVALETRWPVRMEGIGETRLLVSADAGSTWDAVDLSAAGIPAGSTISSIQAGPLGVVLDVRPTADEPVLVVSGDLVDWTATPVADIAGADAVWNVDVTVGADRIVVTSTERPVDEVTPVGSRTVVGTLERD